MRNAFGFGALAAAALVSGAAAATEITVGKSAKLVIDVEFWGRREITSPDPNDPTVDIITYGEPVHGTFQITPQSAPSPTRTSYFLDYDDAVVYGRENTTEPNLPPVSFVTSHWLSPLPTTPLPNAFTGDVSPLPRAVAADGGVADDRVTIGDSVRFRPQEPLNDWFEVRDAYTAVLTDPDTVRQNALFISVRTRLDIIDGLELDQEFELDVRESGGSSSGFFSNVVERYVVGFYRFVVDRLKVSKHLVCTP